MTKDPFWLSPTDSANLIQTIRASEFGAPGLFQNALNHIQRHRSKTRLATRIRRTENAVTQQLVS
jgi:hypothetical protein